MKIIIFIVVIVVAIFVLIAIFSGRCNKCGKFKAMRKIEEYEVDRYTTTKEVTDTEKDNKGKIIKQVNKTIPVTMVKYEMVYKCKYCGNVSKTHHTEEKQKFM